MPIYTVSNQPVQTAQDHSRLDADRGDLWEPVWQVRTQLYPVECELLRSAPVRRLHFLHVNGPAYLHTHYTNTRLQHTLGVFALIAHLRPEDVYLRVAALLHDVGHAPFSHMLESLEGVDHHLWTIERLTTPPIADILQAHHLEPAILLTHISGDPANCLRNSQGIVHADHLDAWVRNALSMGRLPIPAPEILSRLQAKNGYLEMDGELAMAILQLIHIEAQLHCSDASLGTQTILLPLVQQLLDKDVLNLDTLPGMTDGMLESLLLTTPATAEEAARLWYSPEELIVQKVDGRSPDDHDQIVEIDKLYVSQPLVGGKPITQVRVEAKEILQQIDQLRGRYKVYWETQSNLERGEI